MTGEKPPYSPKWVNTEQVTGLNYILAREEFGSIERLDACPLPHEADDVLARVLSRQDMSVMIHDERMRIVYLANRHPHIGPSGEMSHEGLEVGFGKERGSVVPKIWKRVLATGIPEAVEGWFTTRNGNDFFARLEVDLYPFPDGSPGLMSRLIDLTDARRAHERLAILRESVEDKVKELMEVENRFTLVLKNDDTGYFIQDEDLRYLWVHNPFGGYTAEGLMGKTDREAMRPYGHAEYVTAIKQQVLETGQPYRSEGWVPLLEGGKYYCRFLYEPFRKNNGKLCLLGVVKDMTALKFTEMGLQQANDRLTASLGDIRVTNARLETALNQLEEKNRIIETQIAEARAFQFAMLPKGTPMPDRFEICASMETSEQVGGDYYDYLPAGTDSLAVALGDATGHGLRGGIMVSAVRSYFQMKAAESTPAELLGLISSGIEGMKIDQMYMGLVTLQTDGRRCTLASAGMPPVLWYRAGLDRVESIATRSVFLGTGLRTNYLELELHLGAGDILVLMSDGLTEARNAMGDFLPAERIQDTVLKAALHGGDAIVQELMQLQRDWTGFRTPVDDSTVLTLRYTGKKAWS